MAQGNLGARGETIRGAGGGMGEGEVCLGAQLLTAVYVNRVIL